MTQQPSDSMVKIYYPGLGFPVLLTNVPMKKIFGESMNINSELQKVTMHALAIKATALTGGEIRSIRQYLQMTPVEFAQLLGFSRPATCRWELESRQMQPDTEINLRLHLLKRLGIVKFDKRTLEVHSNDEPLSIVTGKPSN